MFTRPVSGQPTPPVYGYQPDNSNLVPNPSIPQTVVNVYQVQQPILQQPTHPGHRIQAPYASIHPGHVVQPYPPLNSLPVTIHVPPLPNPQNNLLIHANIQNMTQQHRSARGGFAYPQQLQQPQQNSNVFIPYQQRPNNNTKGFEY